MQMYKIKRGKLYVRTVFLIKISYIILIHGHWTIAMNYWDISVYIQTVSNNGGRNDAHDAMTRVLTYKIG